MVAEMSESEGHTTGQPMVTFDDILDRVGSRNRWQVLLFTLTSFSGFFSAFHSLGATFLAATPDHWCAIPGSDNASSWGQNWTEALIKEYAIPEDDQCHMYERNYTDVFQQPFHDDLIANVSFANLDEDACDAYVYDHTIFQSTVVTQWDLVCGRTALAATIQSIYMVGIFIGTFTFGILSDRFGRRRSILIATVQFVVCPILSAIPIHYAWYIIFRLLTGMGAGGCFSCCFVMMAEWISPKLRDVSGIAFQIPFGFGYMVLPGIASLIRNWTWLQLTIGLLNGFLLVYFWFMPESPRWLIMNNRLQEALPMLRLAAKFNGIKGVTDKELMKMMESCYAAESERRKGKTAQPSSLSILADLFRTPQMRKRILVSYFIWCSVSLCYYGLSFKAPTMGSGIYLITFLASLTEVPSYIIGCFIIRYLSRRINVISTFLIGGIACLLILAVPPDVTAAVTGLAIGGKFFINITYAIVYLYATEIFPTNNRNIALGTSSMSARVGSSLAPYIVSMVGGNTPLIIFGVASCVSGILCLLLPETKDKLLPETVYDVEISTSVTVESDLSKDEKTDRDESSSL